ncbi:MAG TPA: NGG1p interacting factor NIF3 [Candidatus Moranbacteria bacterium]|nr:MAG: hypothetical protein UW87_C0009G0013 [Candidatus Moranbacteria bacterium GW2011_GWC2_45_10]KKT95094.1 MAG: hypothetical protein UW95_C0004G0012 [Parcubacteria group bacterium GW2011_GWC1_45_14]HAV11275.1 NGG1p interacting factor NIF3 [Candidatus Moranbacteria bacterium]
MTTLEIFELAIKMGKESDFRSKEQIEKKLERIKEKYEKLSKEEKEIFDTERLENPYMDSRIHFDGGSKEIKKVLAGVDIDSAEMMIARYHSNHNPKNPIDAVIGHHPDGKALADLGEVMDLQVDILSQVGVPVNVAEALMKKRIGEVNRGLSPENHYKVVDSARILGMNFLNVHTPADNLVARFVEKKINDDKPEYVGDIIKSLLEIPEYKEAAKMGAGPAIFVGSEENRTGRIVFTEITGGTSGSKEMYEKMAQAGIGTIISMHQKEEYKQEAEKANINVVIAGHISSDSIGMNLFLDELEKKGIEIVPCSGLIRISRNK